MHLMSELDKTFLSATEFSVADYDSTPCDVVVGVTVQIKNGITF